MARSNNLNETQRFRAIEELFGGNRNGVLRRGDINKVTETFKCCPRQISNVWKRYKHQKGRGIVNVSVANRRKGNAGRPTLDIDGMREAVREIPAKTRITLRGLAHALETPPSTMCQNLKKLGLRAASHFFRPLLTDTNKAGRLAWSLRWLREGHVGTRRFHNFYNVVLLDEKWFYTCKQGQI